MKVTEGDGGSSEGIAEEAEGKEGANLKGEGRILGGDRRGRRSAAEAQHAQLESPAPHQFVFPLYIITLIIITRNGQMGMDLIDGSSVPHCYCWKEGRKEGRSRKWKETKKRRMENNGPALPC